VLRVPGEDSKARAFAVMVAGLRQAHDLLAAPPPPAGRPAL